MRCVLSCSYVVLRVLLLALRCSALRCVIALLLALRCVIALRYFVLFRCIALFCCVVLFRFVAFRCFVAFCCVVALLSVVLFRCVALHCVVLHYIALLNCFAMCCCAALRCVVTLRPVVLYCVNTLHCAVLYCISLRCRTLYFIVSETRKVGRNNNLKKVTVDTFVKNERFSVEHSTSYETRTYRIRLMIHTFLQYPDHRVRKCKRGVCSLRCGYGAAPIHIPVFVVRQVPT